MDLLKQDHVLPRGTAGRLTASHGRPALHLRSQHEMATALTKVSAPTVSGKERWTRAKPGLTNVTASVFSFFPSFQIQVFLRTFNLKTLTWMCASHFPGPRLILKREEQPRIRVRPVGPLVAANRPAPARLRSAGTQDLRRSGCPGAGRAGTC